MAKPLAWSWTIPCTELDYSLHGVGLLFLSVCHRNSLRNPLFQPGYRTRQALLPQSRKNRTEPNPHMTAPDKHNARARALSMTQLGQRLLVAIGLVTVAILAAWLWLSWERTRDATTAGAASTDKSAR